ncbi:Uncharacterized membrane protein [Arboricoccus pini]|uniref:Uncharacterized membrane protein n=1 Tax=Arboricoccus pini TaxID=1963835 RepID=A0A212RCD2_9PROT|nr:hypothetical protein [Arboricoccus pini]SNB69749.1 Uncharacterized membrane protein [Arboricoccus pini]
MSYDQYADPGRLLVMEPGWRARDDSLRGWALAGYGLNFASLFTGGITSLVALILAYVKASDARETIYASHFDNQISVFWWSLVWSVVGFIFMFVGIGWLVWGLAFLWFVYRMVKGTVRTVDRVGF